MTLKRLDIINTLLIIASCIAAYLLPFELFLFSYAVLGPLHYLTEINWLRQRQYYTRSHIDARVLLLLGVAVSIIMVAMHNYLKAGFFVILFSFCFAIGAIVFQSAKAKWWFALGSCIFLLVFSYVTPSLYLLLGLFIPSLIHVFVFTLIFMLYGALKNKSIAGYVSVATLIGCGMLLFLYRPPQFFILDEYAENTFAQTGFRRINNLVAQILPANESARGYATPAVVAARFIAFAYTYHYLNWFVKTEVIKWHKIPRRHLITIGLIWMASVGIYIYNYKLGLSALYLLSIMHVILEFPLNYISIAGVWKALRQA